MAIVTIDIFFFLFLYLVPSHLSHALHIVSERVCKGIWSEKGKRQSTLFILQIAKVNLCQTTGDHVACICVGSVWFLFFFFCILSLLDYYFDLFSMHGAANCWNACSDFVVNFAFALCFYLCTVQRIPFA